MAAAGICRGVSKVVEKLEPSAETFSAPTRGSLEKFKLMVFSMRMAAMLLVSPAPRNRI
jgi:hypothetical protein